MPDIETVSDYPANSEHAKQPWAKPELIVLDAAIHGIAGMAGVTTDGGFGDLSDS